MPTPAPGRRPIVMLVHAYYEEDPRVRREAETLVAAGRSVHVIALRRPGDAATGELAGVRLHRVDVQRHQGAGIGTYLGEYLSFFLRAGWWLARSHRRHRFGLVQVHTPPDALAFAALPLRLVGVPIVIDLHEAMPEFFRIRFPAASNPVVHRLLELQERASIAISSAALTVNDALGERLVARGVPAAKIGVVRNSPSLARFDPTAHPVRPFMADGELRLVYAGALSPVYELDVVLHAMTRLRATRPDLPVRLDLYGRDFAEVPLDRLIDDSGLGDAVRAHGRIPLEAVPAAIAEADIGIAPTRRSGFTDFSLSTKLLEYAAMGKPVVASGLPLVERTFPSGTIVTYRPGDPDALAAAVAGLVDDHAAREAGVAATLELVRGMAWEHEAETYLALVERLTGDRRSGPERSA